MLLKVTPTIHVQWHFIKQVALLQIIPVFRVQWHPINLVALLQIIPVFRVYWLLIKLEQSCFEIPEYEKGNGERGRSLGDAKIFR